MIKHIFTLLILLIGISAMVSGQTDTIPAILKDDTSKEATDTLDFVEKYKEYKGEYTSTETDRDSLLMSIKGLRWFLDCGMCDFFESDYDDGYISSKEIIKSFSLGLGANATSVRVREGFVSPVVYGGNAYGGTIYFEGTGPVFYWRNTYLFEKGKISPIKLSSSFNREDHQLLYNQFVADFQAALRIKKSPHYLGVSLSAEGFTIKNINSQEGNQDLINSTINDINNDIGYIGITHLYFNEIYEIPFRTQILLSTLKTSSQPWGDRQFADFNHTFKIDFILNKKQRTKLMMGYTWNVFNQNKELKLYKTIKSNSSLRLTWVL